MKRSTLLRRLMTIAIACEVVYLLLITIIYIFRPQFYLDALFSVFGLNISEVPIHDPNMALLIALYGGVIVFFIIWFVLKIMMDRDANPIVVGILAFILLPASTVVYRIMYDNVLTGYSVQGVTSDIYKFYEANFTVMQYCGWANVGAFIFMLMAYAVARQRFADLD